MKSYVKPSGYIGSGMHSWSNWGGKVLHETPLQDGENAARLLSYYRVPKNYPMVKNGNSLMALMYTMQAMLGYGDNYEDLRDFQQISLKGFGRVLEISSLDEIRKYITRK